MFRFLRRLGGNSVVPVKCFPATAGSYVRGNPIVLTSGLAATGAAAATTFIGICNETATKAANAPLEVILGLDDTVFEVDYSAGTKTTLTDADLGTAFDLKAGTVGNIDLDDVTGGAWVLVGYDNTRKKAHVKLKAANKAI